MPPANGMATAPAERFCRNVRRLTTGDILRQPPSGPRERVPMPKLAFAERGNRTGFSYLGGVDASRPRSDPAHARRPRHVRFSHMRSLRFELTSGHWAHNVYERVHPGRPPAGLNTTNGSAA